MEDDILPRRGKSKQRRISSPTPSSTDQDDDHQEDLSGVKALFVNNGFTEAEVHISNQEENANESHGKDTSDEERDTAVAGNDIDDEAEAEAGGTVFDNQQVIVLYFIISLLMQFVFDFSDSCW